MTVNDARREYRQFMSRGDVAHAFARGAVACECDPQLLALRWEADRLLVQLRTVEAAAGTRPLNDPARPLVIEVCLN